MINRRYLARLRLLSIIEGISTLVLFGVAMPLKYAADLPLAVTIAGTLHGVLFVGLVVMFACGRDIIPLRTRLVVAGVLGAVVPFGPFVVDGRLRRLEQAAD